MSPSSLTDKTSSSVVPPLVGNHLHLRFYSWQLEGTPEESWQECERHAENLRQLLGETPQTFNETEAQPKPSDKLPSHPDFQPPTDLFGNPLQVDLFGNVIEEKPKKKRDNRN